MNRMRFRIILSFALMVALALTAAPAVVRALDNGQCFDCHGDEGIMSWSRDEMASNVKEGGPPKVVRDIGLFPDTTLHVDPDKYKASVHADLSCTDCHADIKDVPHTARLKPVDCSGCHSKIAAAYAKSNHVVAFGGKPIPDPPRCVDCHGAHAVPRQRHPGGQAGAEHPGSAQTLPAAEHGHRPLLPEQLLRQLAAGGYG